MDKKEDQKERESPDLCLIIKGFDNQVQEPNTQINQYLRKSLIDTLEIDTNPADKDAVEK